MDIPVLYEDDALVILEKPVGVVSNRATTVKGITLQDWMRKRMGWAKQARQVEGMSEEEKYFYQRDGLVHRLDKQTSGVMVMAKTPAAFVELLRQFKEREIEKEYLALTHGIWEPKQGEIRLPVGRERRNRKKMGVREDGRESLTVYEVEKEYERLTFPQELGVNVGGYEGFSLVRFYPHTGRMHQIRVHSKHLGYAIVGDRLYAGRKRSRNDRKWAGRMLLSAVKLTLTHPKTQERMSWEKMPEWVVEVDKMWDNS